MCTMSPMHFRLTSTPPPGGFRVLLIALLRRLLERKR